MYISTKRTLIWVCLLFVFIQCRQPVTGSWGDQGDGTYRNPILNADYPDVDVQRFGDTFYMISSTIHTSPGMTILESKDLVNWTIVGHVFETLSWDPRYNWDQMAGYGGGIWAGVLARHEGLWYCYFIYGGLYVSTAEDITGPWSPPIKITDRNVGTDPGVYWDHDERQGWLVCKAGDDPDADDPAMRLVKLYKLSWDGLSLEDEGQVIYRGRGSEACKIYKINGLFYVFLVDNDITDGDRKQIVLRGTRLDGPLERRVVLEMGNGITRSCSQGALLQVPDGSWWFTHQLRQEAWERNAVILSNASFEGRPQYLVPVRWEDGWPVLGVDADGNGIGNTVLYWEKPVQGYPVTAPQTDDDFNAPDLGLQWQWNHNPRDTHWSLTEREGWLRLIAGKPVQPVPPLHRRQRMGSFWNAANTISQRLMGTGQGMAWAKLDISGMKPGQLAGMCHFGGQYILLGIEVDANGQKKLFFNYDGNKINGPEVDRAIIYLRTDNDGNRATFSFSQNKKEWKQLGPEFTLRMGHWRGDRIGFFSWNELVDDPEKSGYLDIDWFRYQYDGPKAK